MNIFLYLVLAHFVADYPLQWGDLVELKQRSHLGLALHSIIHIAVALFFLAPFIGDHRIWYALAFLFVTHYVIDYTKVKLHHSFPKWNTFALYLADQAAHFVVMACIAFYMRDMVPGAMKLWTAFYSCPSLAIYFIALILATFFYDVTRWTYRHSKNKDLPYKRDCCMMCRNAVIVTVVYIVYYIVFTAVSVA